MKVMFFLMSERFFNGLSALISQTLISGIREYYRFNVLTSSSSSISEDDDTEQSSELILLVFESSFNFAELCFI